MIPMLRVSVLSVGLLVAVVPAAGGRMKLTSLLVVDTPAKSGGDAAYRNFVAGEAAAAWRNRVPGVELHLFHADRGERKGSALVVWALDSPERRTAYPADDRRAPFSQAVVEKVGRLSRPHTDYVNESGTFTDYVLIGGERIRELPSVEILGVHYIKVKPGRRDQFEAFVRDKLHPALVGTIPGMSLLYYKGVRGRDAGTYITVFAIESVQRREQFWPTDASEAEAVKEAFRPMKSLARELSGYLVPGSYLDSSTAAAAYFERREWTDFVRVDPPSR
jgi:hypothetical protein